MAQNTERKQKRSLTRNFTRSTRRASTNEHHKSAITDHVRQNNHIMNWEASEIVEEESDKFKRWIKESICIRSNTPTIYEQERGSLSAFSHMDTSDLHPRTRGGGVHRVTGAFIAIINTFRSLSKACDTFDDFQVLTKMADSHQNCQHH